MSSNTVTMSLQCGLVILLTWPFLLAHSLPVDKDEYGIKKLTPEEAERLAAWTEDSKQNIWELSGQFEGDMVLSPDQRNGLVNPAGRWPNREIPYEIDPVFTIDQRNWIIKSLKEFDTKTCIKPRLRKKEDRDYVYISGANNGCYSYVGRQGGKQIINLHSNKPGSGCLRLGTIVHEFLHALGFHHQHSATNRNDFVTIMGGNIESGAEPNFKKCDKTTSFGQKYDYASIMHYSAYAFSKNGEKTIVTKDPNAAIGQRDGLSKIDIAKLDKMYGCK